jgi:phage anti-repressor protein
MSVDIVKLIENNPITTFSGDYQSKLIEKVKNHFTNYEQQMFLSSFYCYLKYDTKNDFVIDLDDIWKWLGFCQKVKAKTLLENHFIQNTDYIKLLSHVGKQIKQPKGGHNKEIFMLNINTFKKVCLKAGTKKADEIHDYFIKLETIMFEITKENCVELKHQLQQIENIKNKETEEKLLRQQELEKEKYLLKHFATIGSIIYIIRVKSFENGSYVIKIGESRRGIQNRYTEHKTNYEECLLLDCFQVDKSKDFESFLHHHCDIHPNKYKILEKHETENELFLIGKDLTYATLLKIINNNIENYNYKVCELLLEIENLKLKNNLQITNSNDESLKELIEINKLLVNKVSSLEKSNQEILNRLNSQQTKIVTGFNQQMPHLGPRLQKINPETLQLIKVYESVTEAMNEDNRIKRPSIIKSIEENTIYCGFRWLLVERNLDPNIVYKIQPTKQTKVQQLGYIAKLNANKTEILNVYLDRKTAARLNGYQSLSALDNPVKNHTLTNGHYYALYDVCDQNLIQHFESINGQVLLYKNGIGQYDLDNNLVKEFSCKYDCIKELKMSDKTLCKALEKNVPYNNYYYKELGAKLSVFQYLEPN